LPVVMITALDSTEDRVRALEAGADDFMTKPVERVELIARVHSALKLKALYDSLESAEHVIFALAAAVEAKDTYTEAHTERVGRGYPDGLEGDEIPLLARIVAVCDAYDALVTDRPYRQGLEADAALRILNNGAGAQWDRRLVQVLSESAVPMRAHGAA